MTIKEMIQACLTALEDGAGPNTRLMILLSSDNEDEIVEILAAEYVHSDDGSGIVELFYNT
jgi:hypothetical protein